MSALLPIYPPIDPEKEPWISATQISNYELCNRKWAWRWLERQYAPPKKFAELGINTHGRLEKWLKYGVVPTGSSKEVLLAQAMIPYLPPPQACERTNVERDELIVVVDVLFNVKIDLFVPMQLSWDGVVRPRTYDHKTSKDPDRWAPRAEEIQNDAQAALYAAWTIILTGKTEIDLQWNYVKSEGAIKVKPVYATVTDAMITPRMQKNIETGRAIKRHIQSTKRALDVVQDLTACDQYGGCPYQGEEHCAIKAKERIQTIMSNFQNNPATQQFLGGVTPPNGAPINPPQFQPQGQPQFQPQGQPQFQPQQPLQPQGPPQFQVPGGQQFSAPMPQFSAPQMPPSAPSTFAPQGAPQPQFTQQGPPQFQPQAPQPSFQPQQQQLPMPQAAFPAPQPPPAQQFTPPGAQQPQEAAKPVGRPTKSKEHALDGSWVIFAASAVQLTNGNTSQAAQIADALVAELRARQ